MGRSNDRPGTRFEDVLEYASQLEAEYHVRIRLGCVPLSRASGKSTHGIEVRAYTLQGRPIAELEREQCLWPGGTAKTREGAEIYLLTRLASALDEWSARARRQAEQWEPGELTPLEQYIANSF